MRRRVTLTWAARQVDMRALYVYCFADSTPPEQPIQSPACLPSHRGQNSLRPCMYPSDILGYVSPETALQLTFKDQWCGPGYSSPRYVLWHCKKLRSAKSVMVEPRLARRCARHLSRFGLTRDRTCSALVWKLPIFGKRTRLLKAGLAHKLEYFFGCAPRKLEFLQRGGRGPSGAWRFSICSDRAEKGEIRFLWYA